MFLASGIMFMLLGMWFWKKHNDFLAKTISVKGKVVSTFSKDTQESITHVPVIQYRHDKLYQFNGEVDAEVHSLKPGSEVIVYINPDKPRIAKLKAGAKESIIVFKLMVILGAASCVVSVFETNQFGSQLSFLFHPVTLGLVIFTLFFFYHKIGSIISLMYIPSFYNENAEEVDN